MDQTKFGIYDEIKQNQTKLLDLVDKSSQESHLLIKHQNIFLTTKFSTLLDTKIEKV